MALGVRVRKTNTSEFGVRVEKKLTLSFESGVGVEKLKRRGQSPESESKNLHNCVALPCHVLFTHTHINICICLCVCVCKLQMTKQGYAVV